MRLIGINGGTFDPIHYGHLRPALEAKQRLDLAEVRFIPCYQPVHKGQPQVSAQQRCEMIGMAIKSQPGFLLDTIEIDQGGPSYMVQTLEVLKPQFADDSLVLMMGTDAFAKFCSWYQWQRILELANILILHRPGQEILSSATAQGMQEPTEEEQLWLDSNVKKYSLPAGQIQELSVTQLDISSTLIRQNLSTGLSADYLTPFSVVQYIQNHKLYQSI